MAAMQQIAAPAAAGTPVWVIVLYSVLITKGLNRSKFSNKAIIKAAILQLYNIHPFVYRTGISATSKKTGTA
jgi:hypothetical protein